jgi:D-2-hydroxyacid dehydrogenase (NADP+)
MPRPKPAETKLLICVWHPFTLWRPPPELASRVRERFPGMQVVHLPDYDRLAEKIIDTDIFVGYSLRPKQFAQARKLKWLHSTAAGVAQLMYPELRASGIAVTNIRGIHATPMAEHVLGVLLALARRFPATIRHQLAGHWAQQDLWDAPIRPRELAGQVLLLVGFGAIGREVARRVRPLGMKIWAVTRSGRIAEDFGGQVDRVFGAAQLDLALPQADFVVLAAPETPETFHMMDARRLGAMKPSAYLVNVARGSLVDEAALLEALGRGAIAGAALDVTEQEPLPASSPLWRLENCFITPHTSGVTEFLWDRQRDLLLENLDRWFSGRELLNRVDLARGY